MNSTATTHYPSEIARARHREQKRSWDRSHLQNRRERCRRYRLRHRVQILAKRRLYYAKNRARLLDYCRSLAATLKAIVVSEYGGACSCCRESNIGFLTVEHVGGWGAEDRRLNGHQIVRVYRRIMALGFPETFSVLCWNCNSGAYFNKGICPHQEKEE
jgi:hypothetical protein